MPDPHRGEHPLPGQRGRGPGPGPAPGAQLPVAAAELRSFLDPVLDGAPAGPLGVAVSGGSDSTALLILAHAWTRDRGRAIEAATVDHGLRPESAAEAAAVASLCQSFGIPHRTLVWGDWQGRGNLQAAARAARYALLLDWARSRGLGAIALGHTLDDQAETFLLRLARGSGVDGLSAMRPATEAEGIVLLRPLLRIRRERLRAFLRDAGIAWAEDPGNADARFQRIRLRGLRDPLAAAGINPERLAGTAAALGRARDALDRDTAEAALACLTPGPAGDLRLRLRPLAALPGETRLRLLAAALCWVAGTAYRPRLDPLVALCDALTSGAPRPATLHGCLLVPSAGAVSILREPGHAAPPVPLARRRWDRRWEVVASAAEDGLEIGALGTSGLRARPRWRDSGYPRLALLTTPAVWRGSDLVAAPILEPCGKWTFRRISAVPPPWAAPVLR